VKVNNVGNDVKYNTNLAAEYFVLSQLYRLGLNAFLTLGNKKSVDIIIQLKNKIVTIDVKGLSGKSCWPIDNFKTVSKNHFLILVCFKDHINDLDVIPECWIVPSKRVNKLKYINPKKTRMVIDRHKIKRVAAELESNWDLLRELGRIAL
jgi:hypothetical protein